MKTKYSFYLEPDVYRMLLRKAETLGYTGRGALSRFIERLATEELVILDTNVRQLLKALDLNPA